MSAFPAADPVAPDASRSWHSPRRIAIVRAVLALAWAAALVIAVGDEVPSTSSDVPIAAAALQSLLKTGVEDTFNAVTIDGDTSTSDTLLAFATGAAAGAPRITRAGDPRLGHFRKAFAGVLASLAEQVARDGEGARKLVEIRVEGAKSKASARRIALTVPFRDRVAGAPSPPAGPA